VDDVITLKLGPEELLVVTNAGPLESVSEYIRFSVAGAVDVSAETAKIDIQGPASRDVLRELGVELADELKYFRCGSTEWRGKPMVVSRTGYTGELGYELFVANEQAAPLWRALLEDERVNPAGLGARDTLRLEVGYPLSGQDVSEGRTPLEAGLDRFIDWKRDFVGKEALLRERERGVRERLVGVETESRRAPRHGFDLLSDGETVGNVTSGAYGPSVGHGIGLAYVKPGFAQAGSVLEAGGRRIPVTVAEPPFYKEGTCRN
jgi:aminomethyltransferase